MQIPTKSSSFKTLESPSTPKSNFASLAPTTPQSQTQQRLSAFITPKQSSSNNTKTDDSRSQVVAAKVAGMGRVILSRQLLVDQLGQDTAESAIKAATTVDKIEPLSFGNGQKDNASANGHVGLVAFASDAAESSSKASRRNSAPLAVDDRLNKVKSWLEQDDDTEDDNDVANAAWSTAPKEWELGLNQSEKANLIATRLEPQLEEPFAQPVSNASDEYELVERVGGKNITTLLMTKKRRVLEDGQENADTKGKGRLVEDRVNCICEDTEEDEGMIQCNQCQFWLHLDCLEISKKRLPRHWKCPRCVDVKPSPTKRLRSSQQGLPIISVTSGSTTPIDRPVTPVLASEPVLVASSLSPRPRGNFFHGFAADMALAPSPQPAHRMSSRLVAPRSPVASPAENSNTRQVPTTPPQGRADYSPRSPLFYRTGRSRLISHNSYDPEHSSHHQPTRGQWVSNWDGQVFQGGEDYHHARQPSHVYSSLLHSLEEDGQWHDMTMTPSRAIPSSSNHYSDYDHHALITPQTVGSKRNSNIQRRDAATGGLIPSASQDFLSSLHHPPQAQFNNTPPTYQHHHPQQLHHHQQHAQKLFGSPQHEYRHIPSPPNSNSSPTNQYYNLHQGPSSPLAPKSHLRRPSNNNHSRMPSWILPSPMSTPFMDHSHVKSHVRRASIGRGEMEASGMSKVPQELAGEGVAMGRSQSGLGIGFEQGSW